jgi:hypothetical protein
MNDDSKQPAPAAAPTPPAAEEPSLAIGDHLAALPVDERPPLDPIAIRVLARRHGELPAAAWAAAIQKFRTERI